MRLLVACLAVLSLPATALAGNKGVAQKKSGLRLKVTQSLFDLQDDWAIVGGEEGDRTRTQTVGLLNPDGGRTEVTYLLGSGFEVGAVAACSSSPPADETASARPSLGSRLTGAYNIPVSEVRGLHPAQVSTRFTAQGRRGPVRVPRASCSAPLRRAGALVQAGDLRSAAGVHLSALHLRGGWRGVEISGRQQTSGSGGLDGPALTGGSTAAGRACVWGLCSRRLSGRDGVPPHHLL